MGRVLVGSEPIRHTLVARTPSIATTRQCDRCRDDGAHGGVRGAEAEHARNARLGVVFDHVGIAVSDPAASERIYRTVLAVLAVEPSHAPGSGWGTTSPARAVQGRGLQLLADRRRRPRTEQVHLAFPAREEVVNHNR